MRVRLYYGKHGCVNREGMERLRLEYKKVSDFNNGFAVVGVLAVGSKKKHLYGVIDKSGNIMFKKITIGLAIAITPI